MSNDLISRKALIEEINSFSMLVTGLRAGKGVLTQYAEEYRKSIINLINEAPTAYDVDKVVESLEAKTFTADLYGDGWDGQTVDNLLCLGDVYEIVKEGGA